MERPYIHDFEEPVAFLRALAHYNKKNVDGFSLRRRARQSGVCSPALISLLLTQRRRLRRDHLTALEAVFGLQSHEVQSMDRWLRASGGKPAEVGVPLRPTLKKNRGPQNHLLRDWVNVYVKDCCHLKRFLPNPKRIAELLGGLASEERVARSIRFLLAHGFWRYDAKGRVVPNEELVVSSHDLPNEKIRAAHRHALQIALRGLEEVPVSRRLASTTVLSVSAGSLKELRELTTKFQQDLNEFVESHPRGDSQLCQVVLHLTPIGGENHA